MYLKHWSSRFSVPLPFPQNSLKGWTPTFPSQNYFTGLSVTRVQHLPSSPFLLFALGHHIYSIVDECIHTLSQGKETYQ